MMRAKIATEIMPYGSFLEELKSGKTVFHFDYSEMMHYLHLSHSHARRFKIGSARVMWWFKEKLYYSQYGVHKANGKYNERKRHNVTGTPIYFYKVKKNKAEITREILPEGILLKKIEIGVTDFYFTTEEMIELLRISVETALKYGLEKPRTMWWHDGKLHFTTQLIYNNPSATAIHFYRITS